MKKRVQVAVELLDQARQACGAASDVEAIELGLRSLITSAAYQRLAALRGSVKDFPDVPRRREDPIEPNA